MNQYAKQLRDCAPSVGNNEDEQTMLMGADEIDRLEKTLWMHGYRPCDIAACNCGGWHGGNSARRLMEIGDALTDAGIDLQGKTLLEGVRAALEALTAAEAVCASSRDLTWGRFKSWLVEGAPDRQTGIEAARKITAFNIRLDNVAAKRKSMTQAAPMTQQPDATPRENS